MKTLFSVVGRKAWTRGFSMLVLLLSIFMAPPVDADILVIAPHPDDDVIMASGVIFRALQNGEPVRVVFMTNGDFGSLAAGYSRPVEAVNAQSQLGMDENDLLFLGYPDGGLEAIRTGYPLESDLYTSTRTGQSETYGNRGLGRSDYHSYRFGAPANYNGANIILDLKTILSESLPEHIFTTSEYDGTSDHTATYRFLRAALAELAAEEPTYTPTIHKTIVWANHLIWPNAYDPTAYFSSTIDLSGTSLLWADRESLDVPVQMQSAFYAGNPKYLAIDAHSSQNGASSFLGRWIHKDEVFWVEPAVGANRPPVVAAGVDQSVAEGATVHLNGTGSFDKDGDALTHEWRQVQGPGVALSNSHSATPAFTAPTGLAGDTTVSFELIVSDGAYRSYPDAVNVVVRSATWTPPVYTNVTASVASVSASTVHAMSDMINLIDGCIDGYTYEHPENAVCEWTSNGQREGAWVQLQWAAPVNVGKIILYDRVNLYDQALQGTVVFSDGSTLNIGLLDNIGRGAEYAFTARPVTSLRYTITAVSSHTSTIGLAEIEVFAASSGVVVNLAPIASATATAAMVTEGAVVQLSAEGSSDPNGDQLSYLWTQVGGRAVALSDEAAVHPTFTAPSDLTADEVLQFTLIVSDGALESAPAVVHVTVQNGTSPGGLDPGEQDGSGGGGSSGCFISSL